MRTVTCAVALATALAGGCGKDGDGATRARPERRGQLAAGPARGDEAADRERPGEAGDRERPGEAPDRERPGEAADRERPGEAADRERPDEAEPPADPKQPKQPKRPDGDLEAEVEALAAAQVLTFLGDSDGTTSDLARRDPGRDLGSTLDGIARNHDELDLDDGDRTLPPDPDRRGTGPEPGLGRGTIDDPHAAAAAPRTGSRVAVGGPDSHDDTTLTGDRVMARIRSTYLAGVKRCHRQALKADPDAAGRARLAFTVGDDGRVRNPRVTGVADDLAACLRSTAARWRFEVPRDDDGDPTEASFTLTLDLRTQ